MRTTRPRQHDDGSSYYEDNYNFLVGGGGWTKHSGPMQKAVGNLQLMLDLDEGRRVSCVDAPSLALTLCSCGRVAGTISGAQCASVPNTDAYINNTCISTTRRVESIGGGSGHGGGSCPPTGQSAPLSGGAE